MDALKELGSMMDPENLSMEIFGKSYNDLNALEMKVLLPLMEKLNERIQGIDLIRLKNGGIVSLNQMTRPIGYR